MRYYLGIDGGGTHTRVGVADEQGRELLRHTGAAGIVDPREPAAAVRVLEALVREALRQAGLAGPAAALCAGLAGVGDPASREAVRAALAAAGLAARVLVVGDGETALEGAHSGGAGLLIIAGTGSIAYGRDRGGSTLRTGGRGLIVGDEGSGYWIGRTALQRALQGEDGRGEPTALLPELLRVLELPAPSAIPSWAGRAAKGEIAALAPQVARVAEAGDGVALGVLRDAAHELARHARALLVRLHLQDEETPVVLLGGVFKNATFYELTGRALAAVSPRLRVKQPDADAVVGALRLARRAAAAPP